ncbi:MAG: type II toxin-antitoxin system VapC family toxin [Spirochaetaceae bacterium]|jgi:predicted nucleic acid-binding protein|nr:type II toxin-antitoxin system VapC family toxin [Spirochaetaceae bacterium]
MNGIKIVFDTCAVIKLLNRQYDIASLGIDIDEASLFTSVIVRMELLSKRNMSSDEEQGIVTFLDDLTVIPLNEVIQQKAIALRQNTSLKLPDSIVAATAIVLDAVLISDDNHLLSLSWSGLQTQRIF